MKKALSPILASVVAAVLAVTSMSVSMPINAHAEEGTPSVTAFATANDLRNANNFTLHTDNGSGVAQTVKFGNGKTWYIAGADSDGSLILMCDPANPLDKRVFNATKGTPYANSDISNYLKVNGLTDHFTTEEQGLMKNPTLYTDGSDSTSDKLYLASGISPEEFLTVGMNGTKIGLYNNGPSDSPYTNASNAEFWLRDRADGWWWEYASCAYPGETSSVKTYGEDSKLNVVPAFDLDMSRVLFASAATAQTAAPDISDAMTLRIKNDRQIKSTVKKNEQTISVTYDSGDSDVYLYVQGKNSEGDWARAVAISGDEEYTLEDIDAPSGTDLSKCEVWLEKTIDRVTYAEWIPRPEQPKGDTSSASGHVHNFEWKVITEPTKDTDGLEGEVCSCGATRNTQKLSAYAYALYQYAIPMINAAKPGQTITFELGEWNSFPKAFMEKIAAKSAEGVTFVFHYKWNHVKQEITIPFGTAVDTGFDWYGPAKMAELYGAY